MKPGSVNEDRKRMQPNKLYTRPDEIAQKRIRINVFWSVSVDDYVTSVFAWRMSQNVVFTLRYNFRR